MELLVKFISACKLDSQGYSLDVLQLLPHQSQMGRIQRMLQKGESINCQQMGLSRSLIRWRVVHASELIPGFVTFVQRSREL